jgi:acyl-CoA synthetase (AMP-forming)/AMP-acid ligase II
VICTAYEIDRAEPGRGDFYPIGRPMKDSKVLVVDGDHVVTEPGRPGELLIGGPQLMRGYWNNPALTDERTVTLGQERYYRSGDLCSWSADGNLEFHGRNDEEIKLLGFRINLNEIKQVMDASPVVREGHPIVVHDAALGNVIGACFTSGAQQPDGADQFARLQALFKRDLPYYMVPSLYFHFDRFPKLPNGKTDKNRIAEIAAQHMTAGESRYVCFGARDGKAVAS